MMTTTQKALQAAGDIGNHVGKVMVIQGIRDLVEEYLGEYRDIFRKKVVYSRSIFEGAMTMWEKKQHKMCAIYRGNITMENFEMLTEVDMHFIDLYEVRYGYGDYHEYTYNQHTKNLHYIFDEDYVTHSDIHV